MRNTFLLLTLLGVLVSCDGDGSTDDGDGFQRATMLKHWADEIIIPSYAHYQQSCQSLRSSERSFADAPTTEHLEELRAAWLEAYRLWQHVAFFDIGKAEEISLRNRTNIYPADTDEIKSLISTTDYNLELPSSYDAQGFPALDFLLYGSADSDNDIIVYLSEPRTAAYLADVVNSLASMSSEVYDSWVTSYRDIFVAADGSSATASTDKLINDYLFHYEKFLRAGKVGIPAGVFSGDEIPSAVEAPYAGEFSKVLLQESFAAIQDFFIGASVLSSIDGTSIDDYLLHVQDRNDLSDISQSIQDQWRVADAAVQSLDDNFQRQLSTDPFQMLRVFDEMQKAVVLLKVDMMQALNIQVDFVDADGD